jgi:hypothetical protein
MKSKYRSMTFTKTVCPADLPRISRARIALIDVDNIVIGPDGLIQPDRAHAAPAEVYAQMSAVELSLAVVSDPARKALGPNLCFEFPRWTWRAAEVGKDAADRQLLDFARAALRQRPGALVAVASGDHGFAQLAELTDLEVVVPRTHHGVARELRPYLRVWRPAGRHDFGLAT